MKREPLLGAAVATLLALQLVANPLEAQERRRIDGWERVAGPGQHQYNLQLFRARGGPVIPIFNGWYVNPDGTKELCFGYFSTNTEEVLEIPIGPDNFIEPVEFDGVQAAHFLPIRGTPDGGRMYQCIFTVNIPGDYEGDVRWTLRIGNEGTEKREFSSPGRTRYTQYLITGERAEDLRTLSPLLRLGPDGPNIVGPDGNHYVAGPLRARVGEPLTLTAWARRDNDMGQPIMLGSVPLGEGEDSRGIRFTWFKHQGPGDVTFGERSAEITRDSWEESMDDFGEAGVEATFAEPGDYVLRVLTHNSRTSWTHLCCWTNGFLRVTVTE